ncbi:hypothetical protein INT46_001742 [Mucor plumbeus]|uniref:Uncharacterized protein n=1 Tax=Mucor plumbeus TaxID=97098 RepID=A0A8H7QCR2_9FUNG|nr:hypothetical protein INT46_001742 [Mucor plumbeus]
MAQLNQELKNHEIAETFGTRSRVPFPNNMPPGSDLYVKWFLSAQNGLQMGNSARAYGRNSSVNFNSEAQKDEYCKARNFGKYRPTKDWIQSEDFASLYVAFSNPIKWSTFIDKNVKNLVRCMFCYEWKFGNQKTRHRCTSKDGEKTAADKFDRHRIRYPHDLVKSYSSVSNDLIAFTGETASVRYIKKTVMSALFESKYNKLVIDNEEATKWFVFGTEDTTDYHWITMAVDVYLQKLSDRNKRFNTPSVIYVPTDHDLTLSLILYTDTWLLAHSSTMAAFEKFFRNHNHLPLFEATCPDCDAYRISPIVEYKRRTKNPTSTKYRRTTHRCKASGQDKTFRFTTMAREFFDLPFELTRAVWHLYRLNDNHFGGFDPLNWRAPAINCKGFGFDDLVSDDENEFKDED